MLKRDETGGLRSGGHLQIFTQHLLKLEVPRGGVGSLPHKGKVPLQLFVRVCEGVVVGDAAQLVCSRGSEGPVAAHQNGAHSGRSDLFFNSILGPGVNPGTPDSEFNATSLEQESHEVPGASDCDYGYKTSKVGRKRHSSAPVSDGTAFRISIYGTNVPRLGPHLLATVQAGRRRKRFSG